MKRHLLMVFATLFFLNINAQNLEDLSQQLLTRQLQLKSTEEIEKKLSNLSLEQLSHSLKTDTHKKTFWINIYNAFIVKKLRSNPKDYNKRNSFFSRKNIRIANHLFSFDDIEHTILRKQKWKFGFGYITKASASNVLKSLVVSQLDSRIHFALNCGAKSCPPIRIYKGIKLESQLNKAQKEFIQSSSKIHLNSIELSKLFLWYKGDFESKSNILKLIEQNTGKDLKTKQIIYSPYLWDIDLNNYILD
ncbi:MAG: hypothetical protein CMC18_09135 [Flavobacteriaceae bacterium]|nr:hypothetical protein [Flavobacteriaceae bacterium]